jgi:hypothetical protein
MGGDMVEGRKGGQAGMLTLQVVLHAYRTTPCTRLGTWCMPAMAMAWLAGWLLCLLCCVSFPPHPSVHT